MGSHNFQPNMTNISQHQKLGKTLLNQPPVSREIKAAPAEHKGVNWLGIGEKDQVVVTSVLICPDEVKAPPRFEIMGYQIDFGAKVEGFKDNYVKNYALTKSHSLMVALFAQVKAGFYGCLLSTLGCSPEDLKELQKQAVEGAIKQNRSLCAENEYNLALMQLYCDAYQEVLARADKQKVAVDPTNASWVKLWEDLKAELKVPSIAILSDAQVKEALQRLKSRPQK